MQKHSIKYIQYKAICDYCYSGSHNSIAFIILSLVYTALIIACSDITCYLIVVLISILNVLYFSNRDKNCSITHQANSNCSINNHQANRNYHQANINYSITHQARIPTNQFLVLSLSILAFIPSAIASYFVFVFNMDNNINQTISLLGIDNISLAALSFAVRSFSLMIVPIIFFLYIDFSYLVYYAMQHMKLPVKIGYPILCAVNSLSNIILDYKNIKRNHQMKNKQNIISILYVLLIFTIKKAVDKGVVLQLYRLNNDKLFIIRMPKWERLNSRIIIANTLIMLAILIILHHK